MIGGLMMAMAFGIVTIPDAVYHGFVDRAKGDVDGQVRHAFEEVLRGVADLSPGSATVVVRFVYQPATEDQDPQSRLKVALLVRAADQAVAETPRILIERGPLAAFYVFRHGDPPPVPWDRLQAVCDIVRRENAIDPLHPPERNDKAPPYYYVTHPLDPNVANDYLTLDGVLGGIHESVVVEIAIEPADASSELAALTRHLARLEAVNRSWDLHDPAEPPGMAHVRGSRSDGISVAHPVKPIREEDPLADRVRRDLERVHETLQDAHLLFNIRVFAETPAVARLAASVVAESSFRHGGYRLIAFDRTHGFLAHALKAAQGVSVVPPPTHDVVFGDREYRPYTNLSRMGSLASVDELTGAFRLPLACGFSPQCLRKNTDPPEFDPRALIVLGHDAAVGPSGSKQATSAVPRGIQVANLIKNVLLIGSPGSGKTSALNLLTQEVLARDIPLFRLDVIKTEARMLKTLKNHHDESIRRMAQKLQIYTVGEDTVSPFRFNPLALIPGISQNEHIENLLSCFQAAFPMSGSMPMLIAEGLERIYDEHPDPDDPPVMADLVKAVSEILVERKYSRDVESDLRAALETRLGALTRRAIGQVFRCQASVPTIEQMASGATILELDSLPEPQACLLGLFVLTSLREHIKATPVPKADVRLVVMLDEAHVLIGGSTDAKPSEEHADPKAYSTQFWCRMLGELRALRVGVVIANQLVSQIPREVCGLTASKFVFKTGETDDAEYLGNTLLLPRAGREDLPRLIPREAYFFTEGYYTARRIKTTDVSDTLGAAPSVPQAALVPYIKDEAWFVEAAERRAFYELSWLTGQILAQHDAWRALADEFRELSRQHPKAVEIKDSHARDRKLREIVVKAGQLERRLRRDSDAFNRRIYTVVLADSGQAAERSAEVGKLRDESVRSYGTLVQQPVAALLDRIGVFTRRCRESMTVR